VITAGKLHLPAIQTSGSEQVLTEMGWRVIIVWECELQSKSRAQATAERVADEICGASIITRRLGSI